MSKLEPLLETLFMNKGGSPDLWKAISKVVNSKPEEAKYFVIYIKKKIKDLNPDVQMLSLDILDYLMVEGKIPVWTQVAAKTFLTDLINVLKTRDAPDVQEKILYLIKVWGLRFESYKEILPNLSETYLVLRSSGVVFPDSVKSDYRKYVGEDEPDRKKSNTNNTNVKTGINFSYSDDFSNNQNNQQNNQQNENQNENNLKLDLNPENYDKKYSKLIVKINLWVENINLANDIIDNTEAGSPPDDGLKYVIDTLRPVENEIVVYIQEKVKNEKLLEILLGINDDLNKTVMRYDAVKAKKRPEQFVSVFAEEKNKNDKKTANKKVTNSNTTSNVKANNVFDIFGDDSAKSNTNQNSNSNKNIVNKEPVKSVDELFDIFNTKPVTTQVNQNQNQNPNNNIFDMNNLNFTGNNTTTNTTNNSNSSSSSQNQNQNPFDNLQTFNMVSNSYSNSNSNSGNKNNLNPNVNNMNVNLKNNNMSNSTQNEKKGVDSLSEKLKNAYIGKESVSQSTGQNVDFTTMNNSKVGQPSQNSMNMMNMNMNMNPNMMNMQPNMMNMQPNMMNMQPNMMNPNMQPNMMNMNMQPNMMNPNMQPNMMNMQPNMMNPNMQPNMMNLNPNMSIQMNSINRNIQPNSKTDFNF